MIAKDADKEFNIEPTEWLSESQRNDFHRADTIASNAKNFLYQQSDEIHSVYRVDYCIGKMIPAGFPRDPNPEQIHEIWMVCFSHSGPGS